MEEPRMWDKKAARIGDFVPLKQALGVRMQT